MTSYPALLFFLGFAASANAAVPTTPPRKITVIAHRGAHLAAPENTLAAFRQAVEFGCDYVELDVRRTKDGKLVLMHDGNVNRMTNGKGKIPDMTLAEIKALEVKTIGKVSGEKVPTFEEALAQCRGKIKIYVDNKTGPPNEVITAIEKHGMLKDVVVYDSVARLQTFKKLRPHVWIMPDHPENLEGIASLARDLKPETLDGNLLKWKQNQIDAAHKAGIQVWVDNLGFYDNESGYQKAVSMGVDAIQSDRPEMLLKFLRQKGLH